MFLYIHYNLGRLLWLLEVGPVPVFDFHKNGMVETSVNLTHTTVSRLPSSSVIHYKDIFMKLDWPGKSVRIGAKLPLYRGFRFAMSLPT